MTKTLLLVLGGLLFCACGDDDTSTDAGPNIPDAFEGTDAGPSDAGNDNRVFTDSVTNPMVDVGTDAGPMDAGPTDGGPMDAGPSDAGFIRPDIGPPPTDAGPRCIIHDMCPDDHFCFEVVEGSDESFCVPGERTGTTPYGDACTTSTQCVSGSCFEGFCTMTCDAEDGCPSPNLPRCQPALGLCVPPRT